MPDNKKELKKVTTAKKKNTSKSTSTSKKKTTSKKTSNVSKKTTPKTKTVTKKTENNQPIKKQDNKTTKNNQQATGIKNAVNKVKNKEVEPVNTISKETKKKKISLIPIKKPEKKNKKIASKKEKLPVKIRITNSLEKIKNKKNDTSKPNKKEKPEKKEPIFTKTTKKWFIIVAVICLVILILEGIYLVIHRINMDNNTVYYDALNSLVVDDTDTVAVGSSNFKYSKNYSYTNGLEKAKLIKYDKNGKIILEKMYKTGINTTFSSIISVSDGYIVVGSGVFSKEEQQNQEREALIIKYDKEGNIIWEKFYHVITDTKFNKVIETTDGYIAIGQSIYANMEMGNHKTGGGIIVKYDYNGNVVWYNNHGGTKSGNFNDIVEVNGNFYVVGKDGSDSANIVKYDKDGKYLWHKNYSYTDGIGFTGIAYLKDTLYVVGSKKVLPDDLKEEDDRTTTNTDALLVAYDLDGNKKYEKTFGGSNYERYNSIVAYNNNLYVVGHTSSKDIGFKIETDGKLMMGLVVRYDKAGNILKKEILGGSNNDNLTDIYTDGVCLYISGYSNSKDGNITTAKNNGKDYFGKVIKLDFKFRTLLVK